MTTQRYSKILIDLKKKLKEAVARHEAEGILFSGGLDSSILASLSPQASLFTVSLGSYGEDSEYARLTATHLGRRHYIAKVEIQEAFEAIPQVIRILKTFDPAIPNDLATYFALQLAKEKGASSVMTGDGADELFCGYSYMFDLDLESYLPRLAKRMRFNSVSLGKTLGISIKQPFLDEKFVEFALGIEPALKVVKEKRRTWGKWILRKAFEGELLHQILWQEKRPIELGSGFSSLRKIIEAKISDEEFQKKQKNYSIRFLNRKHLYYYEVYKKVVGEIPSPQGEESKCPFCGAGMDKRALHCRICGRTKEDLSSYRPGGLIG
jgi:asparagine synthase (glutamine-hydrolysing)